MTKKIHPIGLLPLAAILVLALSCGGCGAPADPECVSAGSACEADDECCSGVCENGACVSDQG